MRLMLLANPKSGAYLAHVHAVGEAREGLLHIRAPERLAWCVCFVCCVSVSWCVVVVVLAVVCLGTTRHYIYTNQRTYS